MTTRLLQILLFTALTIAGVQVRAESPLMAELMDPMKRDAALDELIGRNKYYVSKASPTSTVNHVVICPQPTGDPVYAVFRHEPYDGRYGGGPGNPIGHVIPPYSPVTIPLGGLFTGDYSPVTIPQFPIHSLRDIAAIISMLCVCGCASLPSAHVRPEQPPRKELTMDLLEYTFAALANEDRDVSTFAHWVLVLEHPLPKECSSLQDLKGCTIIPSRQSLSSQRG